MKSAFQHEADGTERFSGAGNFGHSEDSRRDMHEEQYATVRPCAGEYNSTEGPFTLTLHPDVHLGYEQANPSSRKRDIP